MRFPRMNRRLDDQRGMTLVELSIAMGLSVFLAGAVVAVQTTSTERFESSLIEHRINAVSRDGVSKIRKELRSCLSSSVQSFPYVTNNGATIFRYQQAVSFDVANGIANWGAANTIGGHVEYAVLGTDLLRRVVDDQGAVIDQDVLMDNLDLNPPKGGLGFPASFVWDDDENTVTVEVNREFDMNGTKVKRVIRTMVYIDPIFNF